MLRKLAQGDERGARQAADDYRSILGDGNFFIEVQDHGVPEQSRLHPQLVELARDLKLPLLATNDTHYTRPGAARGARPAALHRHRIQPRHAGAPALRDERVLPEVPGRDAPPLPRRAGARPWTTPCAWPRWWTSTWTSTSCASRTSRCPTARPPASWLRKECERGLTARYPRVTDEIRHRLDYELGIIDRMGYSAYFLIVADFTRFAREQGIMTTCRGSAPGSDRHLLAGHHPGRPARVRAALRALPEPGPGDDAGHRHRLRRTRAATR